MLRKLSKYAGAGLLVLVLAGALGLLLFRGSVQRRTDEQRRIASPPGIDLLEKVRLGGLDQSIRIRGQDAQFPLLLFIDGGPGVPEMPFASANSALEKHFIVVHWDQRGAGKSFDPSILPASMNVGQLVSDAEELVNWLRPRFGQEQIFVAAHSTGSVIGMLLAQRQPQLFRAYVGISQVANLQMTESFLYDFAMRAAEEKGNEKAQKELREIGAPPFAAEKQLEVSQKWVNHFAPDKFAALSFSRLRLAFFSPDYNLRDLLRVVRGAKFSFDHLWRELFAVDLFKQVPQVDVPVYFLEGRLDRVVTGEIAEQYFDALQAPRGKQIIWFEHSGHWPQLDEPEKFQKVMVERVLGQNRTQNGGARASE